MLDCVRSALADGHGQPHHDFSQWLDLLDLGANGCLLVLDVIECWIENELVVLIAAEPVGVDLESKGSQNQNTPDGPHYRNKSCHNSTSILLSGPRYRRVREGNAVS
jgi:hypothetical protein